MDEPSDKSPFGCPACHSYAIYRTRLHGIERLLKRKIQKVLVAGYEPDPSIPAQPIFKGRNQQQSRGPRHGSGRPKLPHRK